MHPPGFEPAKYRKELFHSVSKEKIAKNEEYNLSGDRYKEIEVYNGSYPMVELGEILDYEQPTKYIVENVDYDDNYKIPVLTAGQTFILGYTNEKNGIYDNWPVIIFDDFTTDNKFVDFNFKVKSSAMKLLTPKNDNIDLKYVFYMMKKIKFNASTHKRYYLSEYSKIKIPLPPIEIQKKIVEEIDSYQKIIDGAKMVVDNYKPRIEIDKDWEMKELGEVCDVRDGTHDSPKYVSEGYPLITSKNLREGFIDFSNVNYISKEDLDKVNQRSNVDDSDIIMPMIGTIGNPILVKKDREFAIKNVALIKNKLNDVLQSYICHFLASDYFINWINLTKRGGTQNFISLKDIRTTKIPLPPLNIQQQIVKEIEKEQDLVNANKELIKIFEKKIESVISKVWEG